MSGWIILSGNLESLKPKVDRFQKAFSVAGVPEMHLETKPIFGNYLVLLWSWSEAHGADLSITASEDCHQTLLVDGVITGLGRFGSVAGSEATYRLNDLWREHGFALIKEINGSFGCVFLDSSKQEAVFLTDRFASRPVWLANNRNSWCAGNSPSAIAMFQEDTPRLDPAGLWSLFIGSRSLGYSGLYQGVFRLQAGQYALLNGNTQVSAQFKHWLRPAFQAEKGRSVRDWAEEIVNTLSRSSARLQKVSPAPHLFLSGGLDSRIAAATLREQIRTVTLTSSQNNLNARISQRVARRVGSSHHTILRTPYWYLDNFPAAALIAGGNYNIRHAHFIAPILQIRQKLPGASFMLGDLLENFNKHYFKSQHNQKLRFVPENVVSLYSKLFSYTHPKPEEIKRLFQPELVRRLELSWKNELLSFCSEIREVSDDDRDCFDALFRWYNCSLCPTYLMLECIRAFGPERNLMFDNEMLDLLQRIPADMRGAGQLHRWTLWHLDKKLALISDSNYWLPPLLPDNLKRLSKVVRPILGRTRRQFFQLRNGNRPVIKTSGSWHMLSEWYRKDKRHIDFIEQILFDPQCLPPEIFNPGEIRNCWTAFRNGPYSKQYAFEIDILLSFGLLHKQIPTTGISLT